KAVVHHLITPQKIENIYCPGNSEAEIQ
ncbi:hypothetical protein OFM95_27945, partial [Escherichia coli]|nr:hypothetical protein [Escherichia coli]